VDLNLFSDIGSASIFSHSVCRLLVLLILPFDAQFLTLCRPA
jgi:hypothetical protein